MHSRDVYGRWWTVAMLLVCDLECTYFSTWYDFLHHCGLRYSEYVYISHNSFVHNGCCHLPHPHFVCIDKQVVVDNGCSFVSGDVGENFPPSAGIQPTMSIVATSLRRDKESLSIVYQITVWLPSPCLIMYPDVLVVCTQQTVRGLWVGSWLTTMGLEPPTYHATLQFFLYKWKFWLSLTHISSASIEFKLYL